MKKTVLFLAAMLLASGFNSCTCTKEKAPESATTTQATNEKGENTVDIEMDYGTISIEFFPNDAPNTVTRIKELVKEGLYNGLTFHRVVPGFVVQGGDPQGNGTGGSGKKLKAEFNAQKHEEGTVAMARSSDPDSADSQFYISLGRHPHLDNQYTVIGKVTSGMDAVKKIKVGDKMKKVTLK